MQEESLSHQIPTLDLNLARSTSFFFWLSITNLLPQGFLHSPGLPCAHDVLFPGLGLTCELFPSFLCITFLFFHGFLAAFVTSFLVAIAFFFTSSSQNTVSLPLLFIHRIAQSILLVFHQFEFVSKLNSKLSFFQA
jgi:hypothetical protein